tara:strand:+ start:186 stop:524 length:339 start_codon:yes stop_codon:yes gene_type:complete
MAASSLKSTPKPVGSLEIIEVRHPYRRKWEIRIDGYMVGYISENTPKDAFYVKDRGYLGRALGQQRYFAGLVGHENSTFADIDDAKKFAAKQLKKYPNPPKKNDYLRQAINN